MPGGVLSLVQFLIMTSESTHEATISFFQDHNYFGLEVGQVKKKENFMRSKNNSKDLLTSKKKKTSKKV